MLYKVSTSTLGMMASSGHRGSATSFQKLKAHISISKSQAPGPTATSGLAGSRSPSVEKGYREDRDIAHAYPLSSSPSSKWNMTVSRGEQGSKLQEREAERSPGLEARQEVQQETGRELAVLV